MWYPTVSIFRWLYKIKPISVEIYNVIQEALWHGDFDLAQELLPQGECLVDYAEGCPLPEVIEWMVSSGRLRCEFSLAARAIRDLARTGHLERMQQIAQLHSPLPEHHDPLRGYWADAIRYACEYGDLKIVQWLMEHPLGLEACEGLAESQRTGGGFTMDDLLEAAAGRGHIEILQYLCDQPVLYFYNRAVEAAVRGGHLECVECLLIQLSHGGQKANPPTRWKAAITRSGNEALEKRGGPNQSALLTTLLHMGTWN
ncbi:DNA excision repair protein ERCC-6 [Phytophthora pseudosyringae]|uniref:DNA excision repair protein ERCC-6 n=1 Tax=Phytophthora pseudosyringae TaxID=221518 RepID=A0A8T1VKT0_9STRA|nr:DNA excision repair protein ERCC-6 [Phytophthora pseudosyringae]